MNIYEIDQRISALVDDETGEILDFDEFAKLQMERDQKIENIALWVKNLEYQADAICTEEIILSERRKNCERKAERLKSYLLDILGTSKFESARCAVRVYQSKALRIDDPDRLAEWLDGSGHSDCVKTETKIDKRMIANLIKSGETVPGTEFETRYSVGVK